MDRLGPLLHSESVATRRAVSMPYRFDVSHAVVFFRRKIGIEGLESVNMGRRSLQHCGTMLFGIAVACAVVFFRRSQQVWKM